MTTTSTTALYDTLIARMMDFVPAGSPTPDTLRDLLTGGMWAIQPPENALFPYGIVTLDVISDGEHAGLRQEADLEILLEHRPRTYTVASALEGYADLVDQALLWYVESVGNGMLFVRSRSRQSLPPLPDPADRQVCTVRLSYSLVVWPAFLTQYAL